MRLASAVLHAFVPLFVAVDVIGVAPLYLGMTRGLGAEARARVLRASILVAAGVSAGFALLGKGVFVLLGITAADFQVAGGLILVALAGLDLLGTEPRGVAQGVDVGIVPLAVPLIAGPALITTTIVVVDLQGILPTLVALALNLGLCWLVLARVTAVERVLGSTGARAFSKIVSLLLAAIGVRFVRQGLAS
jgi:multiple antibiotic resistance protein